MPPQDSPPELPACFLHKEVDITSFLGCTEHLTAPLFHPETHCPALHLCAPNPSSTPISGATKPLLEVDKADWLLNVLQVLLLGNHPTR